MSDPARQSVDQRRLSTCAVVAGMLRELRLDRSTTERQVKYLSGHISECGTCQQLLNDLVPDPGAAPLEKRVFPEDRDRVMSVLGAIGGDDLLLACLVADSEPGGRKSVEKDSRTCTVVNLCQARVSEDIRDHDTSRFFGALVGQFASGQILTAGDGRYAITRLKKATDFCESYEAHVHSYAAGHRAARNQRVLVRIPRVACDMSDEGATERLRVLTGLIDAEARALQRLAGLEHVAQLLDRGEYEHQLMSGSAKSIFVVYDFIEGDDLPSYFTGRQLQAGAIGTRFAGLQSPKEFFDWARKLSRAVLDIHQRHVLHGDLRPQNILINKGDMPVVVDFGQSLFTYVMKGVDGFQAHHYRAPEDAKTPASDLFSLGGVLFFLATGSDPVGLGQYEDLDVLKQQVELRIREVNPSLCNANGGIVDIISRCLRKRDRVQHASQLLQDIELFNPQCPPTSICHALQSVIPHAERLDAGGKALFKWVASLRTRALRDELSDMAKGVLDLSGDPKNICDAALALASGLGPGDEFIAISVPWFWGPDNMGINGRFLSMNRNAAALGARIRRIFLLDDELRDEHLAKIVAAQRKIAGDLGYSPNYSVRYVKVSPEERRQLIHEGRHVGLFVHQNDPIAMFPVYDEKKLLVTLRFRTGESIANDAYRAFEVLEAESKPLADLCL